MFIVKTLSYFFIYSSYLTYDELCRLSFTKNLTFFSKYQSTLYSQMLRFCLQNL